MCASRGGHERSLECICAGDVLICGFSRRPVVRTLIKYCQDHCGCRKDTIISKDEHTKQLNCPPITTTAGNLLDGTIIFSTPYVTSPFENSSDNPTGSNPVSGHTCSKTCTSVSLGCPQDYAGGCTCYAPPVSFFFWHSGDCGPVHIRSHSLQKRDLALPRRDYYLNATIQYAPNVTALSGPSPDLSAQLASGMLPSPCNASYVSFACGDSPDGIVREPPQNWLGALLPEGAKELPPVPEAFLKIHGEGEGNSPGIVEPTNVR